MSHADHVELVISQYVAMLVNAWSETPWMVPWYQMERFLALPASASSPSFISGGYKSEKLILEKAGIS